MNGMRYLYSKKDDFMDLIIPAYNEEKTLKKRIDELKEIIDGKIIICEDGSTDKTYEIAKKLADGKRIILLHWEKRLGKGKAIKNGIEYSKANELIFLDADISVGNKTIEKFREELRRNDVVIGSRLLKNSKVENRSFLRSFLSRGFNLMVGVLFNTGIADHQCGIKAFKRKKILEILKEIKSDGWFWDAEFLILAKRKGLKIKEIPIRWVDRKNSRIKIVKTIYEMLEEIIRMRFKK